MSKEKGIKKAKQLSQVKVKFISILTDDTKPSNGAGVIVKSNDRVSINCKIQKFDKLQGLLYVEPMIALKADSDDEYYENVDVEKAAHEFLKNETATPSDMNHNFDPLDGVKVVESWVDKSQEGWVWKVTLDVSENEVMMEKAEKDLITGVSIAGTVVQSLEDNPEITKNEKEIEKAEVVGVSLMDLLKNTFKEKMNVDSCWLMDILTDGTAIFEIETHVEGEGWSYDCYQQSYTNTVDGVSLIGEAKEVKRVATYVSKAKKEKSKLTIDEVITELDKAIEKKKELDKINEVEKTEIEEVEKEEKQNKPVSFLSKLKKKTEVK